MAYCGNGKLGGQALAAAMLAVLAWPCTASSALAAAAKADQTAFNVVTYAGKGAASGCGLSFLTRWTDSDQEAFAAMGTINYFAGKKDGRSTVKVRTNVNNTRRTLSFAWMAVRDGGNTKTFSPLSPVQSGPFFTYVGTPDPQGSARLRTAAQDGFVLGLSVIGLPADATVLLPAAPKDVTTRLTRCLGGVTGH